MTHFHLLQFWVSYGYNEEDYETDRHEHKVINFFLLTLFVCGGTFIMAYNPDLQYVAFLFFNITSYVLFNLNNLIMLNKVFCTCLLVV